MPESADLILKVQMDTSGVDQGSAQAEQTLSGLAAEMNSAATGATQAFDRAETSIKKVDGAVDKAAKSMKRLGAETDATAKKIDTNLANAIKGAAMQAGNLAVQLASAYYTSQGDMETATYIQGVGGGLISGAAAGMTVGGPWGAVVGGALGAGAGALSSYFGIQGQERQAAAAEAERQRLEQEREAERQRNISGRAALSIAQGSRSIDRETDRDALERQIQSWQDAIKDTEMKLYLGLTDAFSADADTGVYRTLVEAAKKRLAQIPVDAVEESIYSEEGVNEENPKIRSAESRRKFDAIARIGGTLGGAGISATERKMDLQTRILEACRDAMRQVAENTRAPIATFA